MNNRGFTLVELLVVLVVIGLIMSLTPGLMSRALPGLQQQAAVREIAGALRQVRGRAIRDNRQTALVIDLDERTYGSGQTGTTTLDPSYELAMVVGHTERLGDDRGRIRFFPDGTSTGGKITLSRDDRKYHVLVDWLTGRVSIEE